MLDRRHFLIGAGALLTASFVNRASAFSQKAGAPLILPSVRKPEDTLYVYMQDCEFDENDEVAEYDAKWCVSLGPDQPFAPPPPTWRKHLSALGQRLDTDDEIERVCNERDVPREDLDARERLIELAWQERSGQVVPEFDPCVAVARTASELLKDDLAFAPQRRVGRPEVDRLQEVERARLRAGEVVPPVLPSKAAQARAAFRQRWRQEVGSLV